MGDNLLYNAWTEEELRDAYIAYMAITGQLRSVDGVSSSQLQQNYHLQSATVNSDGDPFNSATGQPPHNASFEQARSPFSSDSSANNAGFPSESYPNEGHPHSIYDNQTESPHASNRLLVCMWRDSCGPCGKHLNEEEVTDHMTSFHLPPPGRTLMKCQWDKCKLKDTRRDTILRHIRQIHLKIRPRCQS
ncbi:hypothetical protein CY34DRAFT_617054 [Suillus luteus UH-Slu-Lm8-n1]|uniref:Uncharacterized protein n=1 Tax=Suillus luteus UH-Slu-Lm8-n1 TaxID=930992 RepID=A0A0D0AKI1_9AGAM|nr:hypothetical protein CY34DRAFT_617054 [Suillus luteus UH-Slu-Lm8-n1]